MKVVFIYGPPAVGKMTVGQELAKMTGLKLLHNHMSLELVNQFFDFGTDEMNKLDKKIRFSIFEAIAKSDLPGMIFTVVWAFNEKEDEEYIQEIMATFDDTKTSFYFVELSADQAVRLERNKHPHRLAHKASKRNLDWSEKSLIKFDEMYRMKANEGEGPQEKVLKINNSHLEAKEVARLIKKHFAW